MRTTTAVAVAVSSLLFAGSAGAAAGKFGPTAGGGSSGGASGSAATSGESISDTGAGTVTAINGEKSKKKWELYAVFETHRLVRQNDLGGDAPNKTFNFFYVYPHYDITDRDRVSLRAGFYERFVADQGETGLRFDDLVFAYTRFIPLPAEFMLRITGSLTAPTSFGSKLAGIVTVPRLGARIDRQFGRVTALLIGYGEYYVAKYRTAVGGNPNPQWHTATVADVEYRVPVIEKLSLGLSASTGWTWYYGVDSTNAGPTVGDSQFSKQPVQQSYGAEVYARYDLPDWEGLRSDITLSYGQGDPTLGYTSVLHDGARHLYYGFNRHVSEVYLALAARY